MNTFRRKLNTNCIGKRLKLYALRIFLPTLSALLFNAAHAEHADRDQPLRFQTDRWVYDDLKQINVLTGHVIITKGTILLKADRVTVQRDPEGYQSMTAYTEGGQLAYFRQKLDGVNEYIEGYGEQIEYDGKREITTLKRRARVRRLQGLAKVINEVQGSTIRYDAQKNLYTADAGQDMAMPGNPTGRVRAMLLPLRGPSNIPVKSSPSNSLHKKPQS